MRFVHNFLFDRLAASMDQMKQKKVFKPMNTTLREISSRIPSFLHQPNTLLGLHYLSRDIFCVLALWYFASHIEGLSARVALHGFSHAAIVVRWALWMFL